MDDKITQELFARLDALAAKIGSTAEQVFPMLLREAQLRGITYTSLGGLLLVLATISVLMASKIPMIVTEYKYGGEPARISKDPAPKAVGLVIAGIIMAIAGFSLTVIHLKEITSPILSLLGR